MRAVLLRNNKKAIPENDHDFGPQETFTFNVNILGHAAEYMPLVFQPYCQTTGDLPHGP